MRLVLDLTDMELKALSYAVVDATNHWSGPPRAVKSLQSVVEKLYPQIPKDWADLLKRLKGEWL